MRPLSADPPSVSTFGTLKGTVSANRAAKATTSLPREPRARRVEAALVKAARTLTSHLDVERVCDAVLDAVEAVFNAGSSWILIYDANSRKLRTVSSRGQ